MDEIELQIAALQAFIPLLERDVDSFMTHVARLTESGDPRVVRPILLLADERSPLSGVMVQMLSLLETVPAKAYVRELLAVLPEFDARAPLYAEQEVKKLLWSEADRRSLVEGVGGLGGESAAALRAVLDRVDTSTLAPAVEEVRQALPADGDR